MGTKTLASVAFILGGLVAMAGCNDAAESTRLAGEMSGCALSRTAEGEWLERVTYTTARASLVATTDTGTSERSLRME